MFPDVWPGGHLNAAVANAVAAILIVAAAAVLLQKFTRRGGGFDPSEVFIYRGEGIIPRNARRVEVDRSVKFIPDKLFFDCDQLEEVRLHKGLLGIGKWAFYGCRSLRVFRCPSTVNKIGKGAFRGCSNLAAVEFPPGLESIEEWTFWGCTSLEEVRIPASVAWIGDCAFHGCTNLSSLQLCEGLRMIGDWAFSRCRSLRELRVPSSVDEIGEDAFYECSSLASVLLREDLAKMKPFAFEGCTSLESFQFVRLSERSKAIGMDEQTASMIQGRLIEITDALTRYYDDTEENREAAEAIWGKCKKNLERAHEFLDYLERLKRAMPVLELAVWKAKIEEEGDDRLQGDIADDEDGGLDVVRDAVRMSQGQQDPQPSRRHCHVTCGADILSAEVRKFLAMSWPRLGDPE